jgi:molybdate transport system ATP-binding protein
MQPDAGRIVINGQTVFDSVRRVNVPPQKRRTGLLFQHYALFPVMTVRENMEIVLRRLSKPERKRRIDEMLEKLRLSEFSNQKPAQLSGGQQQRAAMGRMLVSSPEIIMLDEPFSALDSFLRYAVEAELMEILAPFGGTILFVSHNRDEMYRQCQRILVLDRGKTAALGTTEELFRNPGTLAAARLTGVKNIAPAIAAGTRQINVPEWGLVLETICDVPENLTHAAIRAHHIREALPEETVNCFHFNIVRKQSEPFRIQEYLYDFNNDTETKTKTPLIRYISGAFAPIVPSQEKKQTSQRFCIPPEHLMLLK